MEEANKVHGKAHIFNTFSLKLIAIAAMTIDHFAAAYCIEVSDGNFILNSRLSSGLYYALRCVGRIAFPIFCFLLVEGFIYTRSRYRYLGRLFIFSLISQVPFSLALLKDIHDLSSLNTLFTLTIGLVCLMLLDKADEKQQNSFVCYIAIVFFIITSCILNTDYNIFGILLIICFYRFRGQNLKLFIAMTLLILVFSNPLELFALFALIPIYLYNGKKGIPLRYAFYLYYPVHLLILAFI